MIVSKIPKKQLKFVKNLKIKSKIYQNAFTIIY